MAGSIRERSPGVWELRVALGADLVTGKYRTISKTVRGTKREARRALAQLVTKAEGMAAGTQLKAPTTTLTELVENYLDRWEGSPTTIVGYRSILKHHIKPTIGRYKIGDVDARLLDEFYRYLADEKKLSASRIRQVHGVLRGALGQAVRWELLTRNVGRDVVPPTHRSPDIRLPSAEQVISVLAMADEFDPGFGAFLRLSAATGARRSELSGLLWSSVDLERRTVRFERAVVAAHGLGAVEKDTKNHSKRTVVIDPVTIEALERHRARMEDRAGAAGTVLKEDAYVFSFAADGSEPVYPDSFSHRWHTVRKRAGLDWVRLHDLRHFQATMLLQAGVPVKNVSARIGHRDAATTLNVYAQFLEETDETSAGIIGDLLAGTSKAKPRAGAKKPRAAEKQPSKRPKRSGPATGTRGGSVIEP